MSDLRPSARRPDAPRRVVVGLTGSLVVHVLVAIAVLASRPPPPEPLVHVTLLDDAPAADPAPTVEAALAPGPTGGKRAPHRAAFHPPAASGHPDAVADIAAPPAAPPREVAVHETPAPAAPSPAPSATPTAPRAPTSFRAWRAGHPSPYISAASLAAAGRGAGDGNGDGTGSGGGQGRVRRCVPPSDWDARVVYLLVDASGSMATGGGSEARACSRQFATAALEAGAAVAVVSFAQSSIVSPPSRDRVAVEAALLASPDPRATVLPSREFGALVDRYRDVPAEFVIVSDGRFAWSGDLTDWYRRLLYVNPANRGRVFTIGGSLHLASLDGLRSVGFQVQSYDGFAPDSARTARQ